MKKLALILAISSVSFATEIDYVKFLEKSTMDGITLSDEENDTEYLRFTYKDITTYVNTSKEEIVFNLELDNKTFSETIKESDPEFKAIKEEIKKIRDPYIKERDEKEAQEQKETLEKIKKIIAQ